MKIFLEIQIKLIWAIVSFISVSENNFEIQLTKIDIFHKKIAM